MIMADVFKILFLILGSLIVLVAYWLFFEALFPAIVERARQAYERRPLRAIGVGLLVGAPLVVLGIVLASSAAAPVKFLGASVLVMLVLLALLGSAGLARHIGGRLPSASDGAQPWRRTLRGGTVLSITFVLPIAGWFGVLPIALVSGFGAFLLAIKRQSDSATESVAATTTHAGVADA